MDHDDPGSHIKALQQQIADLQQQLSQERAGLHSLEAVLQNRVRQQEVVAGLGQQALQGTALSDLLNETVIRLAEALDVKYCKILELLPEGDTLLLRAGVGWQEGLVGNAVVAADHDSQAGYTLLSKEPVIVEDLRTETRFSGQPLLHQHAVISGMSVIIHGRRQPFGVLGVHTTRRVTFTKEDIHFLQSIANVLAMAIERKQREETLQQSRDHLEFLAEASAILAASLDLQETLARVAELAVPGIADGCAVDVLMQPLVIQPENGPGGTLTRVAVAHQDPAKVELIYELQRRYPPDPDLPGGLPYVLRTGQSWLYPDITDEFMVAFAQNAEHLQILRRLQLCSVMIVPLKARDRVLGALTLAAAESGRRFTADDLALAEELAQRAALAVDNARLYHEASRVNQELEQRVGQRTAALQHTNAQLEAEIAVRGQAEERIRLQAARTAALVRTAARLNARLDLDAVLRAVCEETAHALDVPVVTVSLYDPDKEVLIPAYSIGLPAKFEATAAPLPRHIYETYTRQMGHLVVVADVQALSDLPNVELYRNLDVRTTVSVSMLREGELMGRLNVGSIGDVRNFSANELALLQGLADQAAQAIQNTRLYQALSQEKSRLELLYSLSHNLTTSLNPATVAARALNLAMTALGAFRGEIFIVQPESKRLELIALAGYDAAAQALIDACSSGGRVTVLLGEGLAGNVAKTGVAIAVPDVSRDPYWLAWPGLADGVCSAAAVPLLAGDTLVGVLGLLSETLDFFTDDHLPLLQAVATPVALSLQNARLYEAEHRAHQVAENLRTANLALSQTLDLGAILDTLLDHVDELVVYDSASAMLLNGRYLTVLAQRGYEKWAEPEAVQQVVFDVYSTPHLHTLVTRQQSVIIDDTATYPDWQPRPGIDHIRCWLGVPLIARGKVVGLLSLDKAEPNAFTQSHLQLAETLAAQATIAIQNARLFEQVRAGRERLRQLTKEVVSAQEEERQRVSRELHDEAGQALTALKISLDLTKASLPPQLQLARGSIDEAMELTDETMDRIRMLAQNLRPPALDTLGLNATLEGLCRDFGHRTNLVIKYTGLDLPPLADAVNISFYRFVQEALTNVAKHANASKVHVALNLLDGLVSITISDNGDGFNVEERTSLNLRASGIGLIGMRERFELLGGRLEIESQPGQGTRLVACAPLQEEK